MKSLNLFVNTLVVVYILLSLSNCQAYIPQNTISRVTRVLEVTAAFERPITAGNEEMARQFYGEYRGIYNELHNLLEGNTIRYNDEYACLSEAAIIVNLRCYVLLDYTLALDARKNNRVEEYKTMISTMYRDWEDEKNFRQAFYERYGF